MEIIAVLLIILFSFIILKILAFFLHAGVFMLTFPFKILGIILSVLLVGLILVPLGLAGALISLVLVPLGLLVLLSPLILVAIGIILLLKNS